MRYDGNEQKSKTGTGGQEYMVCYGSWVDWKPKKERKFVLDGITKKCS